MKGPAMQCAQCGSQNKAGNDYCENCGASLGIKCDVCNHINGPGSHFCDSKTKADIAVLMGRSKFDESDR